MCRHPERAAIDCALVEGTADTTVSAKFRELSDDAVRRHRESHLPAELAKAQQAADVARADDLLVQVRSLHSRAMAILDTAEQAGDLRSALGGIREARGCLELLGRLAGELEPPTVNIVLSQHWIEVRTVVLQALETHPAARLAVAEALDAHAGH